MFLAKNFKHSAIPPGNSGISSTTWKICCSSTSSSSTTSGTYLMSIASPLSSLDWIVDSSTSASLSAICKTSSTFGASGGGGACFGSSCSVIGTISSSKGTSTIPLSAVITTSRLVHSNATNIAANISTSPISKPVVFLPSRSAFGDFLISIKKLL